MVWVSLDLLEDGGQGLFVLAHAVHYTALEVFQLLSGLLDEFGSKLPLLLCGNLARLHFVDQIPQFSHFTVLLLCPFGAFLGQKVKLVVKLMYLNLQVPFGLFVDKVLPRFALLVLRKLEDEILQSRFMFLHGLNFSLLVDQVLFFLHEFRLVLRDVLLLLLEELRKLAFFEDAFQTVFCLDVNHGVLLCLLEDGREFCVVEGRKNGFDI